MHSTQRLRPVTNTAAVTDREPSRSNVPALVGATLLLTCAAYVLILMQPSIGRALAALWTQLGAPSARGPWLGAVIAAGVAVGGAGLGVLALAAFVRGVHSAPYVWLSPILVGFSTLVAARMQLTLPAWGMPVSWFAVLNAFMLLGGGAVMQLRGVLAKLAGFLLASLPLGLLIVGYVQAPALAGAANVPLDAAARLLLFVLAVTWIGVVFMALATHHALANAPQLQTETLKLQRRQVLQALTQLRESQARAQQADQRASIAEQRAQESERLLSQDAEFLASAKPSYARLVLPIGGLVLLMAGSAIAYAQMYVPLTKRVAAAQAFISEAKKTHDAEMASLRTRFGSERDQLRTSIEAERTRSEQALAVAEAAQAKLHAYEAQLAEAPTAKPAIARAPAKAAARVRAARVENSIKRVKHTKGAAAPKAEHAATPDKPKPEPKGAASSRPANDDDPIGGLDGI